MYFRQEALRHYIKREIGERKMEGMGGRRKGGMEREIERDKETDLSII